MIGMDDPRDILKAAGVECAEVDKYWPVVGLQNREIAVLVREDLWMEKDCADAAILTLARLAAKQRGMLELAYTDYEARWNPDWGSFRQHAAWLSDLEADSA